MGERQYEPEAHLSRGRNCVRICMTVLLYYGEFLCEALIHIQTSHIQLRLSLELGEAKARSFVL